MRVEIVIAEGSLEARIKFPGFDPDLWKAEFPDAASLKRGLQRQGILPEMLVESAVQKMHSVLAAARKDNAEECIRQAEALVVAKGVEPKAEEVEGLHFHKTYYFEPEEVQVLRERLLTESMEELEKSPPAGGDLVEKGEEILSYDSLVSGRPGKDVFGGSVPLQPRHRSMPSPGSSLMEADRRWVALKRGFLVLDDNILKIWAPKNGEDGFVWVSPDRMSVRLILKKTEDDDIAPTQEAIKGLIAGKNFAHSVPEGKYRKPLEDFLAGLGDQDVELLSGTPARMGRDGSLELLVDPEPSLPEPETIARIDFKNFTFFRTVKKGEALARIHPPVPGFMGMDVFGEAILAPEARPFAKAPGKNTQVVEGRETRILAGCDGKLALVDGIPEVAETLKVGGDISLKTGNVTFPGSVEVNGDLRDNLEIHASGSVDIAGVVEDGCIVSEGAVVVKGGFTGTGKGVIKSKLSSVTIGYIRNQRIESHSNIVVYNEVVNAFLFARRSIIMKTMDHSVVGGHLVAYHSIEISQAGSPAGIKTILEVGKDFEVERLLQEKRAALKGMEADQDFLDKMLVKLQSLVRWGSSVKPETRLLEQRTKGIIGFLGKALGTARQEVLELETRLYNPGDCFILVRGEAHPGTVLRYRDRAVFIKEIESGKRWVFKN